MPVRGRRGGVRGEVVRVLGPIPQLRRDRRRPDVGQREILWMLGQPIIYSLRIETADRMIQVGHIVTAITLIARGYHEQIADELHRRFGAAKCCAHHHGVDIETIRGEA